MGSLFPVGGARTFLSGWFVRLLPRLVVSCSLGKYCRGNFIFSSTLPNDASGSCDYAPQDHVIMLPDHVTYSPGNMVVLPDHVILFPRPCSPYHVIMLPGPCDYIIHNQAVTTLPHAHSKAVIHLPHAHTLRQLPPSHMHTLLGSHHPPTCTHSQAVTTLPHAHSQAVTTYPPTCTHSQAVTTLHMHKLSGSHHPPHAHTLRQSLPSCDILPRPHGSSPRPCDPVPQTMLPYHVIMLPGPCDYITHNQAVTTLPHAHSQAVIHLPHAHTLGQSPPSHMHTLSGSHHPPMSCHTHNHAVMDPKLIIQFLQFVFSLSSLCLLLFVFFSSLCFFFLSVSQVHGTG